MAWPRGTMNSAAMEFSQWLNLSEVNTTEVLWGEAKQFSTEVSHAESRVTLLPVVIPYKSSGKTFFSF